MVGSSSLHNVYCVVQVPLITYHRLSGSFTNVCGFRPLLKVAWVAQTTSIMTMDDLGIFMIGGSEHLCMYEAFFYVAMCFLH